MSSIMGSESDGTQIEDFDEPLLDLKEVNDLEFEIPQVAPPSLESALWDIESDDSDSTSLSSNSLQSMTYKFRSILYHCILQGVSSQISSARERVDAGLPTVITNSIKYLAVGTSHSYILAFDCEQNLCWCCHDTAADQGAVSALSFNMESTRLLVGYERGYISMVDASSGDVLRRMPNAHAPQTAVLYLRFTFLNNLALCGDSSGCVFSLSFSRRLGVRSWDSKCLFSGARGEVCVFEPLVRGSDIHFLSQNVLVAMATLSKIIVISVRPKLKILFSQELPRISTSLPLISWQLVLVSKTFQPVLAWGRGNVLNYTRVVANSLNNNSIRLLPLRSVQLPYTMNALHWLGTHHIAILDTNENLRLVEVKTQRELELLEIANAGLVYSSAHFKALAVGGGVSEAFALAGERACYNSLSSRGDQLLILGTKAVHMVKLRSWPERLLYLSEQGRWAEVLTLAVKEGKHDKFIIGLLNKYLKNLNQNSVDKESLTAAINCCVKLRKIDILCNELLEAVSIDPKNQEWYYTSLTDHICTGTLSELTPSVTQMLVKYLEGRDPQSLENVLLSLDVACLDLHQVLKICKKFRLYNAWIHITTKTLGDYTSPLVEFLCELTPQNHKLGNIMLVYVSSCLAGLGYPTGIIPEKDIPRVKHDILRYLETIHSINSWPDEPTYPYLRVLLKYNLRECLNVVELAFTEEEFAGEMGQLQRQRLVQILLHIVTPNEFSESQEINLSCFVLRLILSNKLDIDQQTLNKMIKSLTQVGSSLSLRDHIEREEVWLDLLNSKKMSNLKEIHLLHLALNAKCYRVAEHLYELQKDYSNILECYLNDPMRKSEAFTYIMNYINVKDRCIKQQFLSNFKELMIISNEKVGEIVTEYFLDSIEDLYLMLEDDVDLQYKFLQQIITCDIKLSSQMAIKYLEQLCIKDKSAVCSYLDVGSCRNEEALLITEKYEMYDATAMLLEKSGEWLQALELLLKHSMVEAGILLCIRGAEHLDYEGAQRLWLTLLQNTKRDTSGIFLRQLLHAAAPHVPPADLLELVSNANFGDVKGPLQGILTDYTHDIQILTTTFKILGKDLHHGLVKSLSINERGISVTDLNCNLCQQSLLFREDLDTNPLTTVWSCGHSYHFFCTKGDLNKICTKCSMKGELVEAKKSAEDPCESVVVIQFRPNLEGHF